MNVTWWLSWDAPEILRWARLTVSGDGFTEVLDCDGKRHRFSNEADARLWLGEDEYSLLEHMIEDGEVERELVPPQARTDAELVGLMVVDRRGALFP